MFMRRLVLATVVALPLALAPAPAAAAPQGGQGVSGAKKAMPEKKEEKEIPPGIANNYPRGELPPGILRTRGQQPSQEPQDDDEVVEVQQDTTCVPSLSLNPGDSLLFDCTGG